MNENEKVVAALGGSEPAGKTGDERDARIAELEKQLQSERVEHGRLRQALDRNAALEDELRKLKSGSVAKEEAAKLTDEELKGTPREFVETAGGVAATLVAAADGRTDEKIKALRAEMDARDKNAFLSQIGMQNAQFFNDVAPGGDKAAMWEKFKASNRETFAAIMSTHDVARFNMFVGSFYREIGVPNPSGGQGGSAAPEPRTTVGGPQGGQGGDQDGKTYTSEEYLKALEESEDKFRRDGDRKAYEATTAVLNKALNEGRVK